jgi:hypothetical protein
VSPPVFVEAGQARSAVELLDYAGLSEPVMETYRVRPGDSLWRIAERELGSGFRWREIYRLKSGGEPAAEESLKTVREVRLRPSTFRLRSVRLDSSWRNVHCFPPDESPALTVRPAGVVSTDGSTRPCLVDEFTFARMPLTAP